MVGLLWLATSASGQGPQAVTLFIGNERYACEAVPLNEVLVTATQAAMVRPSPTPSATPSPSPTTGFIMPPTPTPETFTPTPAPSKEVWRVVIPVGLNVRDAGLNVVGVLPQGALVDVIPGSAELITGCNRLRTTRGDWIARDCGGAWFLERVE